MKSNVKKEVEAFEKEAIASWHQAMGNKKIPFKDSLLQAGVCSEMLCRAMYFRKRNALPKERRTFFQLIRFFEQKNLIDVQVKSHLNDLRQRANSRKHFHTTVAKPFVDISRFQLVEVVKWYEQESGSKLKGIKIRQYVNSIASSAVHTFAKLLEDEVISKEGFENLVTVNRDYKPESKEGLMRNPVYAALLVDASGSMLFYRDIVIQRQNLALTALRESMICEQNALFVMQHSFDHESKMLNALTRLDAKGKDKVVELSNATYQPRSMTALYDSLFESLSLLNVEANFLKEENTRKPLITVAVITDGEDTYSKPENSPAQIKRLIEGLKQEGDLKSAVLIGLTNKELTVDRLRKLREELGFTEYISIEQNDPKGIRRAFDLWSQQVINTV